MIPEVIPDEAALEHALTEPTPELIRWIPSLRGPLVILGAGGKMGLTVAGLARRAATAAGCPLEVIAVSRFSDPDVRRRIEALGVRTESADLLDPGSLDRLPDAANVISLVGLKFGTSRDPAMTWAINTLSPVNGIRRYPDARWVLLSTGNVYPQVPLESGGSTEESALTPLGEYANAAIARERLFEFATRAQGTPGVRIRLNYAVELRYGVLVDIAQRVWRGEAVDVSNGWFNCIWQGDAADRILRVLDLATAPAPVFNLCCAPPRSVRETAREFGRLLGREVRFQGEETTTTLLSNPTRLESRLGPPPTSLDAVIRRTAEWIQSGGRTLNRPTGFEVRDGKY